MEYLIALGIIGLIFIVYILYDNKRVKLTKYIIEKNLKSDIKQLNILQISDLHNQRFGKNQYKITDLINKNYDFIFITGDLIDRRNTNIDIAMELVNALNGNIYFVQGNHEKGSYKYRELEDKLKEKGIVILNNSKVAFDNIEIVGIQDPNEYININKKVQKDERKEMIENLEKFENHNKFQLLLSHRPEFIDLYEKYGYDVVFSGHAHGGHARIFGIPILAPNQGILPKYAGGIFKLGKTVMINSKGLGNNYVWAKRVFNTPEIVEIKIKNSKI
ncbi:MAG: metallophosphoesterase [Helcococcus sp.]|nr:metallophosphoesterase [Helcococcus sp.]